MRAQHEEKPSGGEDLNDHRAPRGARDAEVQAVHRHDLEHDVGHVGHDHDQQRPAQVVDATHHAVTQKHHEHKRKPDCADTQVGRGRDEHRAVAAEARDERPRGQRENYRRGDPEQAGEPQRVGGRLPRLVRAARAVQKRDVGGDAVLEEVEERNNGEQHGGREREARQRARAQTTHDRGVDQHVERLDGERAERGHGETHDAPFEIVTQQRHDARSYGVDEGVKGRDTLSR